MHSLLCLDPLHSTDLLTNAALIKANPSYKHGMSSLYMKHSQPNSLVLKLRSNWKPHSDICIHACGQINCITILTLAPHEQSVWCAVTKVMGININSNVLTSSLALGPCARVCAATLHWEVMRRGLQMLLWARLALNLPGLGYSLVGSSIQILDFCDEYQQSLIVWDFHVCGHLDSSFWPWTIQVCVPCKGEASVFARSTHVAIIPARQGLHSNRCWPMPSTSPMFANEWIARQTEIRHVRSLMWPSIVVVGHSSGDSL